jgi:hypothetical protein
VFGAIAKSGMQFLESALPATVLDDSWALAPEAPMERRRAHYECAADELCSEIDPRAAILTRPETTSANGVTVLA